jgi:hypothetical protein
MITASVIFLFSGLMLYNNSFSQSQSDRLDELDRRAYEGQLKTYDRCVWSYNRLVSELNVKGPSSLFEVCGEPPLPPKSVSDQGDPVVGFNFSDFGSPTRLELNRDAAVVINALGLTPSINGNAGTAWFAEKQPVAKGFETIFSFQITQLAGIDDFCIPGHIGADGIAFVVQNAASGTGSIGGVGDGIGYSGIPNSIAVEIDTFCNDYLEDPNDNHVSIHSQGQDPNSVHEFASTSLGGPRSAPVNMSDGQLHYGKIAYTSNTMTISIDGQKVVSTPVNLATLLSLDNGTAYVGFTSSTGLGSENHYIKSWSFSTINTPLINWQVSSFNRTGN